MTESWFLGLFWVLISLLSLGLLLAWWLERHQRPRKRRVAWARKP
jgi:hypothetical protein